MFVKLEGSCGWWLVLWNHAREAMWEMGSSPIPLSLSLWFTAALVSTGYIYKFMISNTRLLLKMSGLEKKFFDSLPLR